MNGKAAKRIHRAKWRVYFSKVKPHWNIGDIENHLKREYYAQPYHQRDLRGIAPSRTHKQQRMFDLKYRH